MNNKELEISVLLAEDKDYMSSIIIRYILENPTKEYRGVSINYNVDLATNGTDAVSKYACDKHNIVIMDAYFDDGDIDGVLAIQDILEIDSQSRIIGMSTENDPNVAKFKKSGIKFFLDKPFQDAYLWSRIDCFMEEIVDEYLDGKKNSPFIKSRKELNLKTKNKREHRRKDSHFRGKNQYAEQVDSTNSIESNNLNSSIELESFSSKDSNFPQLKSYDIIQEYNKDLFEIESNTDDFSFNIDNESKEGISDINIELNDFNLDDIGDITDLENLKEDESPLLDSKDTFSIGKTKNNIYNEDVQNNKTFFDEKSFQEKNGKNDVITNKKGYNEIEYTNIYSKKEDVKEEEKLKTIISNDDSFISPYSLYNLKIPDYPIRDSSLDTFLDAEESNKSDRISILEKILTFIKSIFKK